MTDKTTEALKLAEEALYAELESDTYEEFAEAAEKCHKALAAIREALAEQDKQEPVAWRVRGYSQFKTGNPAPWRYVDGADKPTVNKPDCCDFEPLYAAPVRTKDLTDDEIWSKGSQVRLTGGGIKKGLIDFARAVIAADREKNNPLTKPNTGE